MGGPSHTATSPELLPRGCLALRGMLGPGKTVGSKGLTLWQGGSAVQDNGWHSDFGLQSLVRSLCLRLSAVVARSMRARRICQAGAPRKRGS